MSRFLSLLDPVVIAMIAALAITILTSERVRQICKGVFRKPKSRSVLLTIDGRTITIDNPSPAELDELVKAFVDRHAEGDPDTVKRPGEGDVGSGPPSGAEDDAR